MASTSLPSSPDPLPRSPNAAARLARKRATDRRSQRNHRERHRAYVRSLEETIESLKSASNADERVVVLTAENETLRARCAALALQLQRIRTITDENTARPDIAPRSQSPHELNDISTTVDTIGLPSVQTPIDFDDNLAQVDDPSANSFSVVVDDILAPIQPQTSNEATMRPLFEISSEVHTLPEDFALSLITLDPPLGNLLVGNTRSSSPSPPLPEYARPQGSADRLLHAMVEEALAEHNAGRFDTSKPSLNRLLAHGPVDLLSFRLFHYINQYGAMPLHWMLAIFWVQYLYLRWHVLGTDEAYALIPEFMRPTSIERAIPHRISVNMVVWPDVRQGLIRDALTVNPEDVAVELLKNLSSSWASSVVAGDMIASMDVCTMIQRQAEQRDFWKVGPGFLHKYPQYKNCNLGVA